MTKVAGSLVLPTIAAAPSSPVAGQVYYDTGTNKPWVYNGTIWVPMTTGANITASAWSSAVPAFPNDGDIWYATGLGGGLMWTFRYNAGSASAYKWECIGGAPYFNNVDASESTSTGWATVVDLTTVGPAYTPSHAGDWGFNWSVRCHNSVAGGGCVAVMQYYNGSAWILDGATAVYQGPANYDAGLSAQGQFNSVPAGGAMKLGYCALSAGTATYMQRRANFWPIRIS